MGSALDKTFQMQKVENLRTQLMASELHLTFFASHQGKDSTPYQSSLQDFANMWHMLKASRDPNDFIADVLID